MKKEISEKSEKLSNQSSELNYLTNKVIPKLKKENSELKSVKIELTNALEKTTRKYFDQLDISEDLSDKIGKIGAESAVNKVRADKLESEIDTIKESFEAKINDLKKELESFDTSEADHLKEMNQKLRDDLKEVNDKLNKYQDENKKLNDEVIDLRNDLIEIGDYKDEVDKKNNHTIAKLKEENSSLTSQLKIKESSYDKLSNDSNKTISDLKKQIAKLEEALEKESNKGLFNRFK
ncbi:MAG: acyltransferase [Methanobrevibacter sp.]|nr:acyltransferase [Methanobrevibacter sp.]